jgi:hypothetical protein
MGDYLLSYDVAAAAEMYPQLFSFVKEHKLIEQWSQPYNGLYLLKSQSDITTLSLSFDQFFARRVFHVISSISPLWVGGILPADIWNWLKASPAATADLLEFLKQHKEGEQS